MAKNLDGSKKKSIYENPHKGHRERMKQQFLQHGADGLYDHQILELLLFYAIPREDTNPIAHALLNRFGKISGVFDAEYSDLLEVEGVGPNTACLLKFLPVLFTRYMISGLDGEALDTTSALCRYYLFRLATVRNEELWLTCLDDKLRVVSDVKISEGSSSSVPFDINKITVEAIKSKCTNCVLAHNHPFGDSYPSDDDMRLTECIKASLAGADIKIIDHIIVSQREARSMFYGDVVVLEDDSDVKNHEPQE